VRALLAASALVLAVSFASFPASPLVVCSTSIVGDVVSRLAGEDADVRTLLPIGADPHTFEPVPQDLVLLTDASVVFLNGAGLESGLDPVLESAGRPLVRLSDGLELLPFGEGLAHHDETSDVDPHVWFDPAYVVAWTTVIEETLSELVPEAAERFAARAIAYRADLADLEQWVEETVAVLPAASRELVTDHAVFGYFARRFDFTQVGVVFPGASASDPSAREIADLMDRIRTLDVPAVFTGESVRTALVEQIARDTQTELVYVYTGSLTAPDGPAGSYVDLIRYDVTAIVEALCAGD
jgi:ABC-type Zn uptake system ZnuABC Zn-binding protein ZnuA